jgi:uncharacterized membrane protein
MSILIQSITKERLAAFSDGVFAVIITIMVLQLKLPSYPTFNALLGEWPTALSYVVSYFLIVIMWINHHFLWGFAKQSTPKIILWNFVHMLAASLVPFATAWVAATRIAAVPVFVYAAVIVLVNLSYHAFAYEVVPRARLGELSPAIRRRALARSLLTLGLFTTAMVLSLRFPLAAFALVTCVLITYARPEVPFVHERHPTRQSN